MSLLPRISGRGVVCVFRGLGYEVDRQKGSHIVLRHSEAPFRRLTVPDHREIVKVRLESA